MQASCHAPGRSLLGRNALARAPAVLHRERLGARGARPVPSPPMNRLPILLPALIPLSAPAFPAPPPTSNRLPILLLALIQLSASAFAATLPPLDFGGVREEHVMVPMRDGKRLSVYLYFPAGEGKWPAVFEQRYAEITGAGS